MVITLRFHGGVKKTQKKPNKDKAPPSGVLFVVVDIVKRLVTTFYFFGVMFVFVTFAACTLE